MRISDWSSDVCSSDLRLPFRRRGDGGCALRGLWYCWRSGSSQLPCCSVMAWSCGGTPFPSTGGWRSSTMSGFRSEEHTSELQSLMRISYAVFCLQKKKQINNLRQRNHKIDTEIHTTN